MQTMAMAERLTVIIPKLQCSLFLDVPNLSLTHSKKGLLNVKCKCNFIQLHRHINTSLQRPHINDEKEKIGICVNLEKR